MIGSVDIPVAKKQISVGRRGKTVIYIAGYRNLRPEKNLAKPVHTGLPKAFPIIVPTDW